MNHTDTMNTKQLQAALDKARKATAGIKPTQTQNPFFGVGPITDMVKDEYHARLTGYGFNNWIESNYPKLNDTGEQIDNFTLSELSRGMHRGYPSDKVLLDMMHTIHSYFQFPKSNKMAVGLGGGHSGFTVCALHLMNANIDQHIFVDTPAPESEHATTGGFFRQSWGTQLIEMQRHAKNGDENRIHFSEVEGRIPVSAQLEADNIRIFFGVGHETTGATTYLEEDIQHLLHWLEKDRLNRHAVIDSTSLLGSMPWSKETITKVMQHCCIFTPLQKAVGGVSGYFIISLTPEAIELIESNIRNPSWAIARQLKLAVPTDPKKPLTGSASTSIGPFYDPENNRMQGGIINTFSTLAFAETTYCLQRVAREIGDIEVMHARSAENRTLINHWVQQHPLFAPGVENPELRGSAVTLLQVKDPDIDNPELHNNIIAKSKQLLGYEGITHPNGDHEPGLDVARYLNAFPGTPGDYRAWIGGIRPQSDITSLLNAIEYAYNKAKAVALEELLDRQGIHFPSMPQKNNNKPPKVTQALKVLITDHIGMKHDQSGGKDHSEVSRHITDKGGIFHNSAWQPTHTLEPGKIHFFYQPELSTEAELLAHTDADQYHACIVAATHIPQASRFPLGGVRIGTGTGNMCSASWGGSNGEDGEAPLMNTPGYNTRATAHMVFKALLSVLPDLPVDQLHQRVVNNNFDTGKDLTDYPTAKLEHQKIAILGYGNIGREVARLADVFGMRVHVYARSEYQRWIESEGFHYAATPQEAAQGANVLTLHTGLGTFHAATASFSNAALVNTSVLEQLNTGAVLINYDRGEIVDTDALDQALAHGIIGHAAIDADIFLTGTETSGPMKPYLDIEQKHRGKVHLLPHAAADTDHVSRVDGARQAIDQIFDALLYKKVTNIKGSVPPGYTQSRASGIAGIGKVNRVKLHQATKDRDTLSQLRNLSEQLAAFWGAMDASKNADKRATLIERYGEQLTMANNTLHTLTKKLGLYGPYQTNNNTLNEK